MTGKDLSKEVSARMSIPLKKMEPIVTEVFNTIADMLADGEEIKISSFGKFGTRDRAARVGRNPKTGAAVNIPAKTNPFVKFTKTLLADHTV